jgi:DNA-binding NarL/FixJ family response regulator
MPAYLEVWRPEGRERVTLQGERVAVGRDASNEVALPDDGTASRLHAVLERVASGWCLTDLSSHNGTFVNDERVSGERPLHNGDDIRIGKTRLVYRTDENDPELLATEAPLRAPDLTRRQRDVLVALCRPVVSGDVFTEPAAINQIATELGVSGGAVKQHLLRLYDKFGIHETGEHRRARLANEAMRRGAVRLADLRGGSGGP